MGGPEQYVRVWGECPLEVECDDACGTVAAVAEEHCPLACFCVGVLGEVR